MPPRASFTFCRTSVIDPVVLILFDSMSRYRNSSTTCRDEQFVSLEPDRQVRMYEDYVAMQNQARALAEEAHPGDSTSSLRDNEP